MNAELLVKGSSLLISIKVCRTEIGTLLRIHSLRLGIVRVKADYLPEPRPEGVFYLVNRFLPSGTDEPGEEDYAFVVTQPGLTHEDAEELWRELDEILAPHRKKLAGLNRELEEIDRQVRDYAGAEQRPDGSWILRNKRGGVLVDTNAFGEPITEEFTLRKIAYARWRDQVFEPSPFGIETPELL